jgi:hypothetical protein
MYLNRDFNYAKVRELYQLSIRRKFGEVLNLKYKLLYYTYKIKAAVFEVG